MDGWMEAYEGSMDGWMDEGTDVGREGRLSGCLVNEWGEWMDQCVTEVGGWIQGSDAWIKKNDLVHRVHRM